jgi:hypothetical protein
MKHRLALVCVTALAGCSSQPEPLTQTEYCNQYAQDVCDGISPACLMTPAACMAGRLAECTAQAQENAGRDFIPPNAEAYLKTVKAAFGKVKQGDVITPSDFQAMEQARGRVYRGTILANAPCPSDADCLDGLICDKGYCGTAQVVAQGAQCANIGETCPTGFYCSMATGIWVCTSKVTLGGACTDAISPTPAISCLENLRCAAGVCSMKLDFGEACSVNQDCGSGFCEPYAFKCALDIRFANGNIDCQAMGG